MPSDGGGFPPPSPFRAGLACRCPRCGTGRLYRGFLSLRERCEACGLVQYPQARVCLGCRAQDRMTDHKLARRGTVFTFTIDHLAQVPEHPLPMAVVDLAGGGRVYLQVTDAAEGEVAVGRPVTLTFRRLHEGGGNRNYFWKARPA